MKKVILSVLLSITTTYHPQSLTKISVNQINTESNFEYHKQKLVIKLNDEFRSRVNEGLFNQGKLGIPELDNLSLLNNVDKIAFQFPGAKEKYYNGRKIQLANWIKLHFADEINVELLLNNLSKLEGILDVQPIGIHPIIKSSNDPNRVDQWHLDQLNDADIDAEAAWDIESGDEDIIVAILDTGVRYFHKDLGGANASFSNPENSDGNMWLNETNATNGIDDDGNGFVDDWIGWDFVTGITSNIFFSHITGEDYSTTDNDPRDFNGHGTHCAGIVGAINNNGYAVSSPAGGWNNGSQSVSGNGVKIMPLRIGYSINALIYGGEVGLVEMDFAASAFYYAADNGARIASCSWGSSNSGGLGDAIDYFLASGGMIFKAAGNADDEESDYMLDRSDIIGVAATDESDVKSDFSTYGSFVDISAPGSAILSTYHSSDDPENDYIAGLNGTSMATPLAASVAALIWSKNKSWTANQVKTKLLVTADDIYSIPGNSSYINKLGAGRVNAYRALSEGSIDLITFLEGPFLTSSMSNSLNTNGDLPLQSPYPEDPQTVEEIPSGDIIDWVLVELRDKNNSSLVIEQKSAFIKSDGSIRDLDGISLPQFFQHDDDFYIVIRHRNHLPVMSSSTVSL